jgi:uncharacterized SAM-dependent methyltransferase
LGSHKNVNVIDVGSGNAFPVKELLGHLLDRGLLHRYIAIDISDEMLHIAKRNIDEWYSGAVKFEGFVRDVTYERFDDILVDDMLNKGAAETINLVLLLGATPMNLRKPSDMLRTICGSMSREDLLVYTDKPDTEAERNYFNFKVTPDGDSKLSPIHGFIFYLLNIDSSLYDVEMGYDERNSMRYIQVRFKAALTIEFKFDGIERDVYLERGETILLWRAWHMSSLGIISEFEKSGLALVQSNLTRDRQYLLTISGVDTCSASL